MSERDSPFRTELERFVFEPKRKLVHEARSPNVPIRETLIPAGVLLLRVELEGELPNDLVLEEDFKKTVKTASQTSVRVALSASAIEMSFHPGLQIDVTLYGVASLEGITLVFGEPEPRIDMRDIGLGIDPRGKIRERLMEDYGNALRASAFAQRGYDWTRDPHLFDNIARFYQSVSDPSTPRGPFVANLQLDSLTVGAELLRELRSGDEKTFVSMVPGSPITLKVNFQASLGDLIDAFKASPQALADTVVLKSIGVQCSLYVHHEGELLGRIERLEVARDGRVFIHDFTIMQAKAAGAERKINAGAVTLAVFLTLLAGVAELAGSIVKQDYAELSPIVTHGDRLLARSLHWRPNYVSGAIKGKLEPKLTEEIRQVLRENLRAIPGVDLAKVFDLPKDLK